MYTFPPMLSKNATNLWASGGSYSVCSLSNLLLFLGVVQPKGNSYTIVELVILFCLVEVCRIGVLQELSKKVRH